MHAATLRVHVVTSHIIMANPNPITTHILDTARGTPAEGVPITLELQDADAASWKILAQDCTNSDGRVSGLLASNPSAFVAGIYRISFDTKTYFAATGTKAFYPYVRVVFEIEDPPVTFSAEKALFCGSNAPRASIAAANVPRSYSVRTVALRTCRAQHYHVPLLLSPFGYSTYRGS